MKASIAVPSYRDLRLFKTREKFKSGRRGNKKPDARAGNRASTLGHRACGLCESVFHNESASESTQTHDTFVYGHCVGMPLLPITKMALVQ
jgi:hypothetical protein